jgi:hypothetical protein
VKVEDNDEERKFSSKTASKISYFFVKIQKYIYAVIGA